MNSYSNLLPKVQLEIEMANTNTATTLLRTIAPSIEPVWVKTLSACVIGSIIVLGIILNMLLAVLFSIKRHLRSPKNILILSLVFSNILCCLLVLLPALIYVIKNPAYTDGLCEFLGIASQFWWLLQAFSLIVLSYDRYVFVSQAMFYSIKITPDRVYRWCCIFWGVAFVMATFHTFMPPRYTFHDELYSCGTMIGHTDVEWTLGLSVAYYWVPLIIISTFYILIVRHAQRNGMNNFATKRLYNNALFIGAIKSSLMVLGIVLLAWIPQLVLVHLVALQSNTIINLTVRKLVHHCKYVQVVLLPVVLGLCDREVRKQLRKLAYNLRSQINSNKIEPAPTIDERDYSENVSRRNSRSELPSSVQTSRKNSYTENGEAVRKSSFSALTKEFFMSPGTIFHLDPNRRESNESGLTDVYIN